MQPKSCRPFRVVAVATCLLLVAASLLSACALRPPFAEVVLDVDPDFPALVEALQQATQVQVGTSPDKLARVELGDVSFPMSLTLTTTDSGQTEVFLEVWDAQGRVLARHQSTLLFDSSNTRQVTFLLSAPCAEDAECDDGLFCNGTETCQAGRCLGAEDACPSAAVDCVEVVCQEETDTCNTLVDHSLCPAIDVEGALTARYCDVAAGCLIGDPCAEDSECDDGAFCNGIETCVSGRCFGGPPPVADDDNPCTIDACVESDKAIRNISDVNGNACSNVQVEAGICLEGSCQISTCGDAFVDRASGEACDRADANSDTLPNACRSDCQLSRCGDGVVDLGESCDDGNSIETDACLSDCTRNECGDGLLNASAEACDDGNDLDTDACLATCVLNICGDGIVDLANEECDDANANANDGCADCRLTQWNAEVLLGFGESGGNPLQKPVSSPGALITDRAGNVFFHLLQSSQLMRLDVTANKVTVVAGNGSLGADGDGGPATSAAVGGIFSIALDGLGNMFLSDSDDNRIRRIDGRSGVITAVAGTGVLGFSGDGPSWPSVCGRSTQQPRAASYP